VTVTVTATLDVD